MIEPRVKIDNTSRYVGTRGDTAWFDWKVFVDEPPEVLDRIEKVEYLLHPTFVDPLRVADEAQDRFALKSAGWGEFDIVATIHYKDGSRVEQEHALRLGGDDPVRGGRPLPKRK